MIMKYTCSSKQLLC